MKNDECEENLQKPEVEENEEKSSFTKACEKATAESAKRTLKIAESTSETLEKNGSEIACLENNTACQEKLINHVRKEVELLDQGLANMHKTLSKNNLSSSECANVTATAGGIIVTVLGSIIIAGVSPVVGSIAVTSGSISTIYGIGMAIYNSCNLCKKPSLTVKDIDVERAAQNNSHEAIPLQRSC